MFPIGQLTRFEVNNSNYRLLKPWWDVFTDYLSAAMLVVAVLAGLMQASNGNLVCLPAVDCHPGMNEDIQIKNGSCASYLHDYSNSSVITQSKTLLIKLQDRRQYDFIEAECSQKAVHGFTSYFPLIIFVQALILIIVDNFWLKFPHTSAVVEHFIMLVVECFDAPGTCLAVSNTLWETSISRVIENEGNDVETGPKPRALESQRDGLPVADTQPKKTTEALEISEAIKAKSLYEKVKQFQGDVETKGGIFTLRNIYLTQSVLQAMFSLVFIGVDAGYHKKLNQTIKCEIDEVISENYTYFKCSNVISQYFWVTLVIYYVLLVPYSVISLYTCCWTKFMKQNYDFKEEKSNREILHLSDIRSATGDFAFMLYLLNKYSKLYLLKFAVFMSKKNKEMVRDFVLCKEWPLGKLLRLTEDGGRTLRLTDLNGIPTTVFEITELDSLLLENCILTEEDFKRKNWANFHLRSLSLINCNLESIPDAILKQSSLKKLDLSRNRIKSIPAQIEELSNLETLNLASNKITSGQEHTWKMGQLRELSLRDNNKLILDPNTPITLLQLDVNKAMVVNMSDKTWKVLKGIIVTTGIGQDVMVTKYSPDKCPHIESIRNNIDKVYKMTSEPKGLAIIINISRYDYASRMKDRFGPEQDVKNLENLFEGIGYKTVPLREIQSKAHLEEMLKQYVQSIPESHDSLILAVMSHGGERGLCLGNGDTVKVEDIIGFVQSEHLEGKPKIVFIQACRGDKMASSAPKVIDHQECTPLNMFNPSIPSRGIHEQIWKNKRAEEEKPLNEDATSDASHEEARVVEFSSQMDAPVPQDFIFAYSTVEGYTSFRNSQGSWFINAIVDVFSKHAWEEDILSLLTYVNYEVARKLSFQGYKQIPAPQSTLTKKLFLLPGYFGDKNQNCT